MYAIYSLYLNLLPMGDPETRVSNFMAVIQKPFCSSQLKIVTERG